MRHMAPFKDIDTIARAGSIRKAAELLAVSSTALNRRLLTIEEDFGVPIFERNARGLRLSASGELILHHMRNQLSEHERLRTQLSHLSGARRGHVAVAASQALLPSFLPEQITRYRRTHPDVSFNVHLRDREAAETALQDHSADIAVVLEPVKMSVFCNVLSVKQPICCLMGEHHPLARKSMLRLSDCAEYPVALPEAQYGVRYLLDRALMRGLFNIVPAIESDSFEFLRNLPQHEDILTFSIPISLPSQPVAGLVQRPIDPRDVEPGQLSVGYLHGRTLPVAAASFLEHICNGITARFAA